MKFTGYWSIEKTTREQMFRQSTMNDNGEYNIKRDIQLANASSTIPIGRKGWQGLVLVA
jgi:hypothetical protein